jgi:predicted small lipoprotein YifL
MPQRITGAFHCVSDSKRITRKKIMHKPILLLILASILAACGLKGPLYIPPPKPAAAPPAAKVVPPPQTDDKKAPESK